MLVLDGRTSGGGLITFVMQGIASHVASSERMMLVVELSEVVPPLCFANVHRPRTLTRRQGSDSAYLL